MRLVLETQNMIDKGQEILKSAFGQDGYSVIHSPFVTFLKDCTDGNHMIIDGKDYNFKRWIDVNKKRVYWCFGLEKY